MEPKPPEIPTVAPKPPLNPTAKVFKPQKEETPKINPKRVLQKYNVTSKKWTPVETMVVESSVNKNIVAETPLKVGRSQEVPPPGEISPPKPPVRRESEGVRSEGEKPSKLADSNSPQSNERQGHATLNAVPRDEATHKHTPMPHATAVEEKYVQAFPEADQPIDKDEPTKLLYGKSLPISWRDKLTNDLPANRAPTVALFETCYTKKAPITIDAKFGLEERLYFLRPNLNAQSNRLSNERPLRAPINRFNLECHMETEISPLSSTQYSFNESFTEDSNELDISVPYSTDSTNTVKLSQSVSQKAKSLTNSLTSSFKKGTNKIRTVVKKATSKINRSRRKVTPAHACQIEPISSKTVDLKLQSNNPLLHNLATNICNNLSVESSLDVSDLDKQQLMYVTNLSQDSDVTVPEVTPLQVLPGNLPPEIDLSLDKAAKGTVLQYIGEADNAVTAETLNVTETLPNNVNILPKVDSYDEFTSLLLHAQEQHPVETAKLLAPPVRGPFAPPIESNAYNSSVETQIN